MSPMIYIVVFLIALTPVVVNAECAPEITENRRAAIEHDGALGIWFHASVARCLLDAVSELPLIRQRVSLLSERLRIRDDQMTAHRRANALADEAIDRATSEIDRALRSRRHAEERLNVWWRSPVLWFAVGIIVTGSVIALTGWVFLSVD